MNFYEEGATDVADALIERGIALEGGLATVDDARTLADSGLGDRCLRVLVEVEDGDPAEATAHAMAISDELRVLGVRTRQLHHGTGLATWAVLRAALVHGHDIRIGLEDTLLLADGEAAYGNAELVTAACRMSQALLGDG